MSRANKFITVTFYQTTFSASQLIVVNKRRQVVWNADGTCLVGDDGQLFYRHTVDRPVKFSGAR